MKYQSELIKQIIDDRGHEYPPIHYQSECINEWIKEAKGSYPKLTDYEAEWLNYIAENPIGVFPYETLNDVTNATVNNVVPYAYKSAILTGNTLVNLFNVDDSLSVEFSNSRWKYQNRVLNLIGGNKYYVYFFNKLNNLPLHIKPLNTVGEKGGFNVEANTGKVVTLDSTITNAFGYYYFKDGWTGEESKQDIIDKCKILFIEYQEGMENWDIPYFEGMQSVKMPGLKATGKNLFDKEAFYNDWKGKQETYVYKEVVDGEEVLKINNFNKLWEDGKGFKISVKKDNPLTMSMKCKRAGASDTMAVLSIRYGDNARATFGQCKSDEWIEVNTKFTPSQNYIEICSGYNVNDYFYIKDVQLEYGSTVTSYDPNKSNILTVNEPIELRGIVDVKDTLDLTTGELTQRIGEVVLDGSDDEKWTYNEKYDVFVFEDLIYTNNYLSTHNLIKATWSGFYRFNLRPSTYGITSTSEGREYLSNHPITLQYKLESESVKTVDLTIKNQDGETLSIIKPIEGTMSITTDGSPIKPTFSGEIPVEAITQNLASFIGGE